MGIPFDWTLAIGLVVTAALIATASLLALSVLPARQGGQAASIFAQPTPSTVLIFDGEALVDATPAGHSLLAADDGSGGPWMRILTRLEPVFPGLGARLSGLAREGRFIMCSREGVKPPVVLRAEQVGGLTRLTLVDADVDQQMPGNDSVAELALQDEIAGLREAMSHAPVPMWRETAEGVIWANTPYLRAVAELLEPGQELAWPLPPLFPTADAALARGALRRSLVIGGATHWFELKGAAVRGGTLWCALPVDKLVQAEVTLRDFMQTLTKTFAQLPIGLAIFDRTRVLQLFNPALIDLTGLPAEFLIARPTLSSLLDAMRERSMLPEPKDYRSWRKQIVELEEAAASGLFEDTWTLPSGQTYRVTGRPHPNGALAFMFEDISTEMMRTRRYRADLELGQAVIDAMDDAVVVFAQDGSLALSNQAATDLWGVAPLGLVGTGGEPAALALWREQSAPSLLWNDLGDYIGTFGPRDPWDGEVRLRDGRLLDCRVSPMPHGATLVGFRLRMASRQLDSLRDDAGPAVMIA